MTKYPGRSLVAVTVTLTLSLACVRPASAQVRSLYASGFSALNSGILPDEGLSYENMFQLYSFNQLKDKHGNSLPVGLASSAAIDHNNFEYVTPYKLLHGTVAFILDVPMTTNSLSAVHFGEIAGSAGLSDLFVAPLLLAWKFEHVQVQAAYSMILPTGRFKAGANNNLGAGYWANMPIAMETVFLTKDKATQFSAFQGYTFNTTQPGTGVRPGQNLNIDYSITQLVPLDKDKHSLLQVGLVGYEQFQTTRNSGSVSPAQAANKFRVNAIGPVANIMLPGRKFSVSIKYFKEFGIRSSVQGNSLQVAAGTTF